MKTEFIISQFAHKPCIAISFKEPQFPAFITPLLFLPEKPEIDQQQLSDYMASQLNQPIFKDMLALIASVAEEYAENAGQI